MSNATRSAREQANLLLARRFYDAIFSGDWSAIGQCIGPAFVVIEADGMPYRGTWKGLEGLQELFAQMSARYYDDMQISEKAMAATDDHVLAYFTLSGAAKPTGVRVDVELLELMHIKDGLIDTLKPFYWDTKAIAEAFGE